MVWPACGSIEFHAEKNKECSILDVLNFIASHSDHQSWYDIGIALKLPPNELNAIKEYPVSDRMAHLVELWHRLDPQGFSWEKLQNALEVPVPRSKHRDVVDGRHHIIKEKVEDLTDKFFSLIKHTKSQLDLKKEKIDDVHDTLVYLPQDLSAIYSPLLEKDYHALEKCNSHRDFFSKLRDCWNFIDFDLLERIIKVHGDASLKSEMKCYLKELRQFCESTTVYDLIKTWKPKLPLNISEELEEFIVVLRKENPKTCTIQMLDNLRHETCTAIRLSKTAMILYRIAGGSVKVVWLVAKKHDSLFSGLIKTKYSVIIDQYGIEFLSLDNRILYPEEVSYFCRENFKSVPNFQGSWLGL